MILVDSSVWIDHIHAPDPILLTLLAKGEVLAHPFVVGEIALGTIRTREAVIASLRSLPTARVATDEEVMHLIEQHRLYGTGIGYVDVHLLTAARLSNGTLWARDRRLRDAASRLGLQANLYH